MLLLSVIMTCESRAQNLDTILKLGEASPFEGVLLDPQVYRDLSASSMKEKDFEENLDKYIKCEGMTPFNQVALFSFNGFSIVAVVGLAGLITGVIIGMNH